MGEDGYYVIESCVGYGFCRGVCAIGVDDACNREVLVNGLVT